MKKYKNLGNLFELNVVLHSVPHGGAVHTATRRDITMRGARTNKHAWFHSWCIEEKAAMQRRNLAEALLWLVDRSALRLAEFPITVTVFSEKERANLNPKRRCERCDRLLARMPTQPKLEAVA